MNTINTGEQVVLAMKQGGAVWGTLHNITETHIILNDIESDDPYTLAEYADEVGFPFSDIRRVIYKKEVVWETSKQCKKCLEEKVVSDFHVAKKNNDGYQPYCKKCNGETANTQDIKGRLLAKPLQKKFGLSRADAAIRLGIKDENCLANFSKYLAEGPNECIVWTGSTNKGYGLFAVTIGDAKVSTIRAHRFSWAMRHGIDALPKSKVSGLDSDTLVLNHTCHNRACVNPAHLEVITHRENTSVEKRKPKESK